MMKITRSELRAIINESIFNISQSPVLQKLGVRTGAEREKIQNCKEVASIINKLGSSPKQLIRDLRKILTKSALWFARYELKQDLNIDLKRTNFYSVVVAAHPSKIPQFVRWFQTQASAFSGSGRMSSTSIGVDIPDDYIKLVPLLHNISRPGVASRPVMQAFKKDKNVSFRPEDLDPSVDHHPERLRIHQDEKREAMTNLELEFDITLPNRESIVPLLISRFSTQQPSPDQIKDFERFLRGVSKCSAANGGPSIDGVVE